MTAIGVTVFLLGGGLVLLVARSGSASPRAHGTAVSAGPPTVVVATRDLTAGTSGDDVVREKLVTTKAVASNQVSAGAITSLAQLSGTVFSKDVSQNAQIVGTDLSAVTPQASVPSLAVPAGDQAVTVNLPAAPGLAGVASPGDIVNVYANVTKAGTACTQLVASNVPVLDVFPRGDAHKAGTLGTLNGTIGASQVSFLLAVSPATAQSIVFFAANETLYLTLVPQGQPPTAAQLCSGYPQQVHRP